MNPMQSPNTGVGRGLSFPPPSFGEQDRRPPKGPYKVSLGLGYFYGPTVRVMPPVIPSTRLVDRKQFRRPRSKKKRIRSKWKKRAANYKMVPSKNVWLCNVPGVGKYIICHPVAVGWVRRHFYERGNVVGCLPLTTT